MSAKDGVSGAESVGEGEGKVGYWEGEHCWNTVYIWR
jgi:hypothetical protein